MGVPDACQYKIAGGRYHMVTRKESDSIGTMEVPVKAYYGVQTLRAKNNFHITGRPLHGEFIRNLARIKKAAAFTNMTAHVLDERVGNAIVAACDEIIGGKLHGQFIVDAIQGGAGTSANMNANEVIANRAIEILGGTKGDYSLVHPNDHVNMAQSTNDVIPCAGKLTILGLLPGLLDELERLQKSLHQKSIEFDDVVKMGRTQLQDAVPIRLGQSFEAYAAVIGRDIRRIREQMDELKYLNIGATAVGTAINVNPVYLFHIIRNINLVCQTECVQADDLFDATQNLDCFVHTSSTLRICAVNLSKICNDLRLLSSGPKAGLGEINLPPRQNGSSIMPGKVNPTQCESLTMLAAQVMGNDVTISIAGSNGQFELNVFKPVIISNFLQSARLIGDGCLNFSERCVKGITPVNENIKRHLDSSLMLVTALNPKIGYYKAAAIAQKAYQENKTLREAAIESGYVTAEEFDRWVDPSKMVGKIE